MAPRKRFAEPLVWRFQRSQQYPEQITGLTKDRSQFFFTKMDAFWAAKFGERFTFYAVAQVSGGITKPHVLLGREVESW